MRFLEDGRYKVWLQQRLATAACDTTTLGFQVGRHAAYLCCNLFAADHLTTCSTCVVVQSLSTRLNASPTCAWFRHHASAQGAAAMIYCHDLQPIATAPKACRLAACKKRCCFDVLPPLLLLLLLTTGCPCVWVAAKQAAHAAALCEHQEAHPRPCSTHG
jgi:hypothetical protein